MNIELILFWLIVGWLCLLLIGTPILYIGFGFAMSAKCARDKGLSQSAVVKFDSALAFPFMVLDAVLNVVVYSFIACDFRREYTLTYLSERLTRYSMDPNERPFRKFIADVFAAFIDGKDPSGDHVLGENRRFPWLD